jgi:PAS domain S-box-containing protein
MNETILHSHSRTEFLAGGGEMGKLIGTMDWSKTPLGPIESWPQSLRTTVSLCLASNFPISLAWGPRHTQIYNDGYWPICGAKHPHSTGQDFSECWASAWPVIGEAFERALAGQTSYLENQRMFLDRNGYLEETFFTFSFSPIRDESGGVGGLFHPVTEQTGKMLSERRTRALRDLSARTGKAKSIADVFETAAQTLAEYDLDIPFVLFYALDDDGTRARLAAHAGIAPGTHASPDVIDLNAAAAPWSFDDALRLGEGRQVDGLEPRFGKIACGPYPEMPKTAFVLPIFPPGSERPLALLVAGVSARLPLDETYRGFVDLLAATVTAAVANARAYEDERRRAEALAELDRAKTAFFSNISHEFRTPLSLLLGPVEDALGDTAAVLPKVQRERLEMAHRNALRLLKLVNALLDFSRIEAGRVRAAFEPVDLAAFTAELASNFRSACERAGLNLVVDCPAMQEAVYVDRDMWEKIVLNLISNAFKFTFKGAITVSLCAAGDAGVELAVRDTGTGIAAHELPRLFERFHRIEGALGRTFEGSGIGLALVQELTKLHGGALTVESLEGQGSVFRVTLPLGAGHLPADKVRESRQRAPAAFANAFVAEALRWLSDAPGISPAFMEPPDQLVGHAGQADAMPGTKRGRVVLADDNADMRDYVARILTEHGYDVRGVADGEAALDAAHEGAPPDLVLTDVMMPRLDGFGLLRALRLDPAMEGVLVILLSARAGEEARVEGLAAGADDYLIKPFSARELLARVDGAVRLARVRREAAARERALEAEIVTERGRAALRESEALRRVTEEKYRLLMDQAPDATLVLDPRGVVLEANRQVEAMFGRPRAEMVGNVLRDFIAPSYAAALQKALDGAAHGLVNLRLAARGGKERDIEVSATRVRIGDGEIILFIARDITERLSLEQQLRQAQKMEAVGQLTGGVAHDFNNILTVITGTTEMLSELVAGEPRLATLAKSIDEAAERGAHLTQRMLAFARKQPLQPHVLDLNAVIARMVVILRRTLGEDIAVVPKPGGDLWQALADPSQIEDAILNLAVNARDAMPRGGDLVIETANATLDEDYAAQNDEVSPGDYVVVTVTDSGTGMPAEVIARVFEPFFTTKDVGQGTGLGLSMVYGFIKQSRGHVKIYSELGHGTSIKIYLPRVAGAATTDEARTARPPVRSGQQEIILVVEDDPAVRATAVMMLRSLGYRIREAEDGQAALAIIESAQEIDLLFSDLIMPNGMNGYDLLAKARERRPALRALCTSGYSEHFIKQRGNIDRSVAILGKPYGKQKLAQKIREALDGG